MKRLEEVLQNKQDNYILPFFWQHGEDEQTLREYMGAIETANIKAVCVESRPHPDFCGDKWWTDMDVILDEAEKRGMKVWILDDSHFPTGFANGAIEKADRSLHHKYLCKRTLEMTGPAQNLEFELEQYMKPATLPPWVPQPPKKDDDFADDKLVSIIACKLEEGEKFSNLIDLTDCIVETSAAKEGDQPKHLVRFDLPDGYYKIFVVYATRNGRGRNNYINFLDKASCRLLIDAVYEPHYAHYAKYFGNVIAGFFSDEPPVGNVDGYMPIGPVGVPDQDLAWAADCEDLFTKEFGSDGWKKILPYLWGDAVDSAARAKVRNAYMEMTTKLVAECFSAQNGQWCEAHGVEYIGHQLEDCDMSTNLGASMGHFFRGLSGQHMAGIDNIGGQVMINATDVPRHDQTACRDEAGFYQYMIGKMGASHAAIDPKKQGRTMCENFGAYGWQSGPKEEKYMMDHFMVRGVNRFVPHAFSPAPFPDFDCPPHFYAHGENPTYRAFGELMAYSNRVCHLIDGGKAMPDVALLYNAESVWAGDYTSNIPACRALAQSQVDFHLIPADVFAEGGDYPTDFDGKTLKVNGNEYRALVISGGAYLAANVADFVQKAIEVDFPILFTDRRPVGIVAANPKENAAFAQKIKNTPVVPVQKIGSFIKEETHICLHTLCESEKKMLTSYHYMLEDRQEFFLLNETGGETYTGSVKVEASGIPVRYYPWENRMEMADYTKADENHLTLNLSLEPLELCMIIFAKDEAEALELCKPYAKEAGLSQIANWKNAEEIKEFSVAMIESKKYPEGNRGNFSEKVQAPFVGMQQKYPDFAGYYAYQTEIRMEKEKQYAISIENVGETVEVFVNEQSIGTKVQAPFFFAIPSEISIALKEGEKSSLRIEVATLTERKVRAMGIDVASMSCHRPFSPTGIVGKVELLSI